MYKKIHALHYNNIIIQIITRNIYINPIGGKEREMMSYIYTFYAFF
jgi:hypothetical protein